MKHIEEVFKKFVELQKQEKPTAKAEEGDKKGGAQFRRKTSVPLINRSLSFNAGPTSSFGQADTPRVVIEGDGGLGKSSLLAYARDLALQEDFAMWFVFSSLFLLLESFVLIFFFFFFLFVCLFVCFFVVFLTAFQKPMRWTSPRHFLFTAISSWRSSVLWSHTLKKRQPLPQNPFLERLQSSLTLGQGSIPLPTSSRVTRPFLPRSSLRRKPKREFLFQNSTNIL